MQKSSVQRKTSWRKQNSLSAVPELGKMLLIKDNGIICDDLVGGKIQNSV